MRDATAQNLRAVAPKILSGEIKGAEPFTPEIVKKAIAILEILKDREWHTATQISETANIGAKYARDILQTCSQEWSLESHRRNGFRLMLHVCPNCQSIYYPDPEANHTYHECDGCGWHWIEEKN